MGRDYRSHGGADPSRASGRRTGRGRRDHEHARTGDSGPRRCAAGLAWRDRSLHPPSVRVPLRRRPVHELPSAQEHVARLGAHIWWRRS